jgi:anti-anti-sigma factor
VPDLRFPVTLAGPVPIVGVPEELDATNVDGLRTALLEAARVNQMVVVDLRQTRFCDSAGLQMIVAARRRARDQDGDVLLASAGTAVLRILSITGVDQVIPSFATLDEALAYARG